MVTENIEAFIKQFNDLGASDITALEHVIQTRKDEADKYNLKSQREIKALQEMQAMLKKRFKFVDEYGKVKEAGTRKAKGENLERIIAFIGRQDFPISVSTIASSLELSTASVYHLIGKHKEKFIKTAEGYELAARE